MLVIKIYATKKVPVRPGEGTEKDQQFHIDLELIDELQINNVGQREGDMWEYEIEKPEGTFGKLIHFRSQGYRPLLRKALGVLIGHKPGGTEGGE